VVNCNHDAAPHKLTLRVLCTSGESFTVFGAGDSAAQDLIVYHANGEKSVIVGRWTLRNFSYTAKDADR
jgi:hypothetical protein